MTIAFLVPISFLLLFLLARFLLGLGGYLFTMLAWFCGALVIVILLNFWNILPPVPFIFLGTIGLICAPFVGIYLRDQREQRQEPEKQRQRKLKEQKTSEWWLLCKLEDELSGLALVRQCRSVRWRSAAIRDWLGLN
jgi:hypothetical protein